MDIDSASLYFVAGKIARTVQAIRTLHEFSMLSLLANETKGSSCPSLSGSVYFLESTTILVPPATRILCHLIF
jgi:hypothetical protein